ncbi:MAG TPA: hypothetical protein VHS78_17235 [Candidatus Elarobacter sp.]|jgi:hypothetical protein|nr:hypothetical protein [Candidatus Elarobacter sp.]
MSTSTINGAAVAAKPAAITASKVTQILPHFPPIPLNLTTADDVQSGVAAAIGCRYLRATNQLAFVEFGSGKIGLMDLIAPMTGVANGTATIPAGGTFSCDTGTVGGANPDLWWESGGSTHRIVPSGNARIFALGAADYAALTSASLQAFPYTDDPSNDPAAGAVLAVHTNGNRYAKVQVTSAGADLHIAWTTYQIGSRVRYPATGFDVLEDILVEPDGIHAYVTERDGDLLRVDLSSHVPGGAGMLATGFNTPQQMQFSGDGSAIYVVEYAAPGRLIRVDKATGAKHVVTAALDHAIGVVLSAGDQYAYVSEQSASGGRVRRVEIATGAIANVASGFTAPFMMAWLDESRQRIVLCERDPANRLATIDLGNANHVARPVSGLDFRPSAPAVIGDGRIYVTCNDAIDEVAIGGSVFIGDLWKGIGFVPVERIVASGPNAGRADTSVDPNYPYQFHNAPFASSLPIRINHLSAWLGGARWYRFVLNGTPLADPFWDYKRNPVTNLLDLVQTAPSTMTLHLPSGTTSGSVLPVRDLVSLMLWFQSDLGGRVNSADTTIVPHDGVSTLEVQFFDAGGTFQHYAGEGPHAVYFNNSRCFASVALPALNGGVVASDECGVLYYGALNTDTVTLTVQVAHANTDPNPLTRQDDATFSWGVQRGIHPLSLPAFTIPPGHTLPNSPATETIPLTTLLHKVNPPAPPAPQYCSTAGFVEELYVASTAIDGESRVGLDASAQVAFCLAPSTP